jgi:hypothetical protein
MLNITGITYTAITECICFRSDQESRAVEVCQLMPDVDTIQLAIQYAAKIKRYSFCSSLLFLNFYWLIAEVRSLITLSLMGTRIRIQLFSLIRIMIQLPGIHLMLIRILLLIK